MYRSIVAAVYMYLGTKHAARNNASLTALSFALFGACAFNVLSSHHSGYAVSLLFLLCRRLAF